MHGMGLKKGGALKVDRLLACTMPRITFVTDGIPACSLHGPPFYSFIKTRREFQ
jgi:hypothetical protein